MRRHDRSAGGVRCGSARTRSQGRQLPISTRRIEDLVCPADKKDTLEFDNGLGVRVTQRARKGSLLGKSYLAQYSIGGIKRRVPLGSCAAISLAAAREAVRTIL